MIGNLEKIAVVICNRHAIKQCIMKVAKLVNPFFEVLVSV